MLSQHCDLLLLDMLVLLEVQEYALTLDKGTVMIPGMIRLTGIVAYPSEKR
jgi:hypothetical protein